MVEWLMVDGERQRIDAGANSKFQIPNSKQTGKSPKRKIKPSVFVSLEFAIWFPRFGFVSLEFGFWNLDFLGLRA
ncbi:MAG: hypothetical protein KKD33_03885 [Verrucomicrobia bacterium]|nr:hypothetical protein [Verrucomicrobiota bacterium]